MMGAWGEGELARSGLSPKTTVASLRKCLWRVFHSGFGGLLFVFGELAFSFHLAWQNFNTSAFHLNKSSVSGSRFLWWNDLFHMQKSRTFSCISGERVKLLLMKSKASNSMGDITMNQKIRVVVGVFFNYAEWHQDETFINTELFACAWRAIRNYIYQQQSPLGVPWVLRPILGPRWVNAWGILRCWILHNLCAQIQENLTLCLPSLSFPISKSQ